MTPLLFLHGVEGGHHSWERQLPYFCAHGCPSHAWDQPGYGSSLLVEPYDLANVARSLASLIEWLDAGPVVLVGHSMGGFVAQELYARQPHLVKALALCFTSSSFGGGTGEFARRFVEDRVAPLDRGSTMADIARVLMPTMRGPESAPCGLARAESIMAGVSPETYRKAVAMLTTFDRSADLGAIAVPTLLVAGSDDRTAPPSVMARMAQRIRGAEYVELQGCGHLGPADRPEAFNAVLEEFLRRHRF